MGERAQKEAFVQLILDEKQAGKLDDMNSAGDGDGDGDVGGGAG